jgi:hypothetical protein
VKVFLITALLVGNTFCTCQKFLSFTIYSRELEDIFFSDAADVLMQEALVREDKS